MKRLVIGDIHGSLKATKQVLERANFNPEIDMLIGLGDYVDGWNESYEVVSYLMNLPNFKGILGNHDHWLLDYLSYGAVPHIWTSQGGQATLDSYQGFLGEPNVEEHRKFLSSLPYYLEIDDKLFVHGGVYISENGIDLRALSGERLMWDRVLFTNVIYNKYKFNNAFKHKLNLHPYSELYLGHTTTQNAKPDFTPIAHNNIYLLDQGGGWDGKLTAMDIDTKEYWQSDFTPTLHPEVKGRG